MKYLANKIEQNTCVNFSLSSVLVFATLWTVAHQAPLCMGFPKQEYWSGLLLLSPLYGLYASKFLHRANQRIVTQIEYLNSTSKRLANEYYLYFFVKIFMMYIMFYEHLL